MHIFCKGTFLCHFDHENSISFLFFSPSLCSKEAQLVLGCIIVVNLYP